MAPEGVGPQLADDLARDSEGRTATKIATTVDRNMVSVSTKLQGGGPVGSSRWISKVRLGVPPAIED